MSKPVRNKRFEWQRGDVRIVRPARAKAKSRKTDTPQVGRR